MGLMSVPWGSIVLAAAGAGLLVRTFRRPARWIIARGSIKACPAPGNPRLLLHDPKGASAVYALTPGSLASSSDGKTAVIHSDIEPVVLKYHFGSQHGILDAAKVGLGQRIGAAHQLAFEVIDTRTQQHIEPTSWLVARGLTPIRPGGATLVGNEWCRGTQRVVTAPAAVGRSMKLPDPSALLLPASVRIG